MDTAAGGDSELGRGFTSALTGAGAAAHAAVGAALDYAGLRNPAASQFQVAREGAQRAALQAPFTESLRDIRGASDIPKYVAGKVGEAGAMLPAAIAGGAAGSLVGAPEIGAALPFVATSAGDSLLPHIKEDNTLDRPVGELAPTALGRGVVEGGLTALGPGLVTRALAGATVPAKTFLGGVAKGAARDAAVQGVAAPAGLAAGNAIEGKPTTPEDLANAALGGITGIAPLAAGAHAVGGVKVAAKPKEVTPPNAAPNAAEPAPQPATPKDAAPDWAQKVAAGAKPFESADATDHGQAAALLREGLTNVKPGEDLRTKRDEMNGVATKYAEQLVQDDRVPQETRDRVAQAMQSGDISSEWNTLANYADTLNQSAKDNEPSAKDNLGGAVQAIKDLGKSVNERLRSVKEKASEEDQAKFSNMDTSEMTNLRDYVFSHLKDEYKNDPDALGAARSAAYALSRVSALGDDSSARTYGRAASHIIDDLVQDKQEFLKGLPTELKRALGDQPNSIRADAIEGGSAFDTYINPELTNGERMQVAKRFEQYVRGDIPDQYDKPVRAALAEQVGGEKNLRALIEHYGDRYEREAEKSEGTQEFDPNEQGTSLTETGEPKPTFTYADDSGEPRGFTSKQGAFDALDKLRAADPDFEKNHSVVPLREAADEHGGADALKQKVLADYEARATQDEQHADEPVPGTSFTRGDRAQALRKAMENPEALLDKRYVIKTEGRDHTEGVATRADLKAMRTLDARKVKDPEAKQAIADGNFQVEYANGKRLTVNAESVAKTMDAKRRARGEQAGAEGDHQYWSQMFKEGVAQILARPDVKAVHGADRADLLIDRGLGLRFRNLSGSVEHGRAIAEHSDTLAKIDQQIADANKEERGYIRKRYETFLNKKDVSPVRKALAREVLERLDRHEARLAEDRMHESGFYDKREGMTDIVVERENQERQERAKLQSDKYERKFAETGDKPGEEGGKKATPSTAQHVDDRSSVPGVNALVDRMAQAKTPRERGQLHNQIVDTIGEHYAPSAVGSETGGFDPYQRVRTSRDIDQALYDRRIREARRALTQYVDDSGVARDDPRVQDLVKEIRIAMDLSARGDVTTIGVASHVQLLMRQLAHMLPGETQSLEAYERLNPVLDKLLRPLIPMSDEQLAALQKTISDQLGTQIRSIVESVVPHMGLDRVSSLMGAGMVDPRGREVVSVGALIAAAFAPKGREYEAAQITAHHEVMHAALARIERQYGDGITKRLIDAAQQEHIRRQVLDDPANAASKDYLAKNPEEMLVQAYGMWAVGKLKLNETSELKGFFQNFKLVTKALLRLLTGDKALAEVFGAVKRGELADRAPLNETEFMDRMNAARVRGDLKYSKERPGAKEVTPEERAAAEKEFVRIAGDDIKRAWDDLSGASGKWDPQKDTVTFSKFAGDPNSVAWHEALHALFSKLIDKDSRTKMWASLDRIGNSGIIVRQLEKLLKDHPDALEQIRKDPEERLAYMFQFYRAGALRVGPETKTIFGKVMDFIHMITGTVSKWEQAERYMNAIYDGKFSDPSKAALVIHDMKNETLKERVNRLMGPVGEAAERLLEPTIGRLNATQIPALQKLARMYHATPDQEESNKPGFLQERARMQGKFESRVYDALKDVNAEQGRDLVRELRSGNVTSARGKAVQGILRDVFKYMQDADVRRAIADKDGKVTGWAKLQPRADYGMPQIWNRDAILRDPTKFVQDMVKAGVDAKDAEAIHRIITRPNDHDAVNMSQVGFTPFNRSVNSREFHFTPDQLKALEPYLDNDPVRLLTTYVHQATHRAEHSRVFSYDGSKVQGLLKAAQRQGATKEELDMAEKSLKALDGTLGADMDPKLRKVLSGVVVYENMALLPFALFSSLVDPLNAAARSGSWADARRAMVMGIKGLVTKQNDENYQMARTIGLISEANMLEKFGDLYNGMYMAKWLKGMNDKFFKLNGMESWNKSMRTAAMIAGERFMLKHATRPEEHSERYLRELGIEKSDIKELPDGRIAKTQEQGLTAEQEERVQKAIFRYVDDAVLRPNSGHRPIWGSDPHYQFMFHLKQYSFSYHETFIKRALHEAEYGNYMPLWTLAAAVPFMDVVDTAQDFLFGGTVHHAAGGLFRAIARSGVLGTKTFALDAVTDPAYGGVPGQSFLGPAVNHGIYAAQTLAGQHSAGGLFFRSIPAGGLVHGLAS